MAEPRRRPWHLYLLVALAVLVTVLAVSEIGPPASSARTSTQTVTAEQGVVQSTVTGSGNIEPGTDLDVNFQTSGTLSSVDVQVGQHVNKGQLLATLGQSSAQLTLDQAEQSLTAAQDQLSSAESSTAASIASAQAAVDSAQASMDNAQTAFNDTNLYAPISGTIVSLAGLSPGDAVSAGSTGSASSSGTSSGSITTSSSSGSATGTASGTTAGGLGGSSGASRF